MQTWPIYRIGREFCWFKEIVVAQVDNTFRYARVAKSEFAIEKSAFTSDEKARLISLRVNGLIVRRLTNSISISSKKRSIQG